MGETGITQAELAKTIGHSEPYVSQALNGAQRNPTLKTLVKFACALDAIVEIRLAVDGREVVRVMDFDTAKEFDDRVADAGTLLDIAATSGFHDDSIGNVSYIEPYRRRRAATAAAFTATAAASTASSPRLEAGSNG
jgi:transcriptional regulator with XRE-family HTH domain